MSGRLQQLTARAARRAFQCGFLATLVVSCVSRDLPVQPGEPHPEFEIVDAGHNSGNPHFFFLPPMVSPPSFSGPFDGSLSPVVEICRWNGTACALPLLVRFTTTTGRGAQRVRVDLANELYAVNWNTERPDAEERKTYRIRVLVAGTELGHADVVIVSRGKKIRNVSTGALIQLAEDRTLPIKFRIEQGAVFVVGPGGGTIGAFGGALKLTVPSGAIPRDLGITVQTASAFPGSPVVIGPVYDLGPSGTQFPRPVTLTLRYDPQNLPSGVREEELSAATVENGEWVPLSHPDDPSTVQDVIHHTITVLVQHFSLAAVVAPPPTLGPILLRRPWQPNEFWVPRTYVGHFDGYWQKGVDFYYATNQFSGSFDPNDPRKGDGNIDQANTTHRPLYAAHAGTARLVLGTVFCNGTTLAYHYLEIRADGDAFKTWYVHIRVRDDIGASGRHVDAGDPIGTVAGPNDPVDQRGCAKSVHFMMIVVNSSGGVVFLDDPNRVLMEGEAIFSGPRNVCPGCNDGADVYTYSAMPRNKPGGQDVTSPQLIAFDFTPKTISTANGVATVTVNFTMTDDISGATRIDVGFSNPSQTNIQWGSISGLAPATTQRGSLDVTFPQFSEAGTWTVQAILWDATGNSRSLSTAVLSAKGFPTTLTVTSGVQDVTPPQLTAFDFTPKTISTNGVATVTVNFTMTDDISGATRIDVGFSNPSQTITQWGSISGLAPATTQRGSLDVTFPQFSEAGTWTVQAILWDAAGNSRSLSTADLSAKGFLTTLTITP